MVIFKITENTAKPAQLAAGSTLSVRGRKRGSLSFLVGRITAHPFYRILAVRVGLETRRATANASVSASWGRGEAFQVR